MCKTFPSLQAEISAEIWSPQTIDEFPVLCSCCIGPWKNKDNRRKGMRVKESDRIAAMATELRKMEVNVKELKTVIIEGREKLKSSVIQSYGDHRITMSMQQ
jgi:3-phosphoshikimate 1-carboxyvinyltransferase